MFYVKTALRVFLTAEDGAVTVDWVVLTAAVVGLGMGTTAAVRTGTSSLGGDIETSLSNTAVASLGELGDDGVAPFSYSPLLLTMDEIDTMIQNQQAYDDATLQGMYGQLVWQANNNIDGGSPESSRIFIDMLYAVNENLTTRNLDIPDGEPTVADMVDRYNTATG